MSLGLKEEKETLPLWLNEILAFFADHNLDELVLCTQGNITLTRKDNQHEVLKKKLKTKELNKDFQLFAFSQGLRLDPFSPFAGGSLKEASYRWHCVIPPVSEQGFFFLRRHRFDLLSIKDFKSPPKALEKIQSFMKKSEPFLVAGPTGSGKTSLLSLLLSSYYSKRRLVILEDYEELPVKNNLWLKLIARKESINNKVFFSLDFLFREVLRMRPDHIVLGELRGSEIKTFLELCHSGHQGACSTIHANSLKDIMIRLEIILAREKINPRNLLHESNLWIIFMDSSGGTKQIKEVRTLSSF